MTELTAEAVAEHSREMIRKGSRSFSAAAMLFNAEMRADVEMLYAWCRHCDDVIDGQMLGFAQDRGDARPPEERLAALQAQTRAALDGAPQSDPVFEAFQRVALKHQMPERYPLDLLAGFAMDVSERRYETITDVLDYCYHVAGCVGLMMAVVMGVRDRETLLRAHDLGIAFQLTNISRDVIEDAEGGRVYLPAEWLAEAGVGAAPADVADPQNRAGVAETAARLLSLADAYYDSSLEGIKRLNFRCGLAIAAARGVYRDIGVKVRARGERAWDARVHTSGGRKLSLTAGAALRVLRLMLGGKEMRPRGDLWTKPGV